MSFIGSMFNGSQGAGYQAQGPGAAETGQALNRATSGLAQQQAFVNQLQGSQGLQNQANVFQQQQALANQLQQQAAGQGPNPAQAALNQQTGNNIAAQAALQASQRGASANAGLAARNAAVQGGNMQQQATGQGATMQAQQQLNAQQALAQQQQALQGVAQQQVGQQAQGLNQLNSASQGLSGQYLGSLANQNEVNAGIAKGNQSSQSNALSGLTNNLAAAGMAFLAEGGEVQAQDSGWAERWKQMSKGFGKVSDAPVMMADGGMAPLSIAQPPSNQPRSKVAQALLGQSQAPTPMASGQFGQALGNSLHSLFSSTPSAAPGPVKEDWAGYMQTGQVPTSNQWANAMQGTQGNVQLAHGGKVPAMVSPGEVYIKPENVKEVAKGKDPRAVGEQIPGKPKVKGNSLKNDVVPKTLEAGGIVIPNSVMQSKDPAKEAHKFVSAILAKQGLKGRR